MLYCPFIILICNFLKQKGIITQSTLIFLFYFKSTLNAVRKLLRQWRQQQFSPTKTGTLFKHKKIVFIKLVKIFQKPNAIDCNILQYRLVKKRKPYVFWMTISQRTQHVYAAFARKLVKINLWRGSLNWWIQKITNLQRFDKLSI